MAQTQNFVLEVQVRIRDLNQSSSGLEVRQEARLSACGFLEAAKILGKFHDLVETVKSDQGLN